MRRSCCCKDAIFLLKSSNSSCSLWNCRTFFPQIRRLHAAQSFLACEFIVAKMFVQPDAVGKIFCYFVVKKLSQFGTFYVGRSVVSQSVIFPFLPIFVGMFAGPTFFSRNAKKERTFVVVKNVIDYECFKRFPYRSQG